MSDPTCFYGLSMDDSSELTICPKGGIAPYTIDNGTSIFDASVYGTAMDLDFLWVLVAGCLVFFMQTGFTLLESGMVKHTNVQNILFKNVMDACLGALSWFLFGYCVAYGDDEKSNGFIGMGNVALQSEDYNAFFFQWAFAATAATIVSGSVAERCRLDAYFVYTAVLTLWVYPTVVHWMWSGTGWLSPFNENISLINGGVIDFAGSGVVHMVGGWSGLMGAVFLGPRYLRFAATGSGTEQKTKRLQHQFKYGHNVPYQVLGTFILWFGWYGFNAGSTLGANYLMTLASKVAVNTTLSAAMGGATVALIERLSSDIWMIPAVCNGVLAGLVSITAPCAVVKPWAAICIGGIGGVIYWCASNLLSKLKVDDPLDAFSVHGACGFFGVISVGIFAYDKADIAFAGYSDEVVNLSQVYRLGIQVMAAVVIAAWTSIWAILMFGALNLTKRLRIDVEEEKSGLDQAEHGGKGYAMSKVYSTRKMAVPNISNEEEIQDLTNKLQEEIQEEKP